MTWFPFTCRFATVKEGDSSKHRTSHAAWPPWGNGSLVSFFSPPSRGPPQVEPARTNDRITADDMRCMVFSFNLGLAPTRGRGHAQLHPLVRRPAAKPNTERKDEG